MILLHKKYKICVMHFHYKSMVDNDMPGAGPFFLPQGHGWQDL